MIAISHCDHTSPVQIRCAKLVWLLLGWCLASATQAHEMRPAFLQLNETSAGEFAVLWKQPVLDNRRLPLEPVLPQECVRSASRAPERTATALLETWVSRCELRTGTLTVAGLTKTLTDVMVRIRYLNGDVLQHILRPDDPSLDLTDQTPGVLAYFVIGVEHLVFGIDHILFVVGLVLYIHGFVPLLKTITSFTIAHSITLALSVLDLAYVPQAPVEAIIALSIVFLARELVLPEHQRSSLTTQRPWIMAFGFGLLHGFGFAGALAEIGLPQDQLALALLLFNLGIEIGQIMVVLSVIALAWLGQRAWQHLKSPKIEPITTGSSALNTTARLGVLTWPTAVAMGCIAGYWTIDRVLQLLV